MEESPDKDRRSIRPEFAIFTITLYGSIVPYANPEKQRQFQAKWRRNKSHVRRKLLWEAKRRSCADCGVQYPPYVMDFDHVRGVKTLKLSSVVMQRSKGAVLAEIEKCDIVCANCHRERTYQRMLTKRKGLDLPGYFVPTPKLRTPT